MICKFLWQRPELQLKHKNQLTRLSGILYCYFYSSVFFKHTHIPILTTLWYLICLSTAIVIQRPMLREWCWWKRKSEVEIETRFKVQNEESLSTQDNHWETAVCQHPDRYSNNYLNWITTHLLWMICMETSDLLFTSQSYKISQIQCVND